MSSLLFLVLNLMSGAFDSCQNTVLQLYQAEQVQQDVEFSSLTQWHAAYCYRTHDGDLSHALEPLAGDYVFTYKGEWSPHRYGELAGEEHAQVLFDDSGRYRPRKGN